MPAQFVNLHAHTSYSILQSLASPKDLFLRAKELGQSAIGIADTGTFAGLWECLKYSKETKVKLIAGCEFYFVDSVDNKTGKLRFIVLFAKNAIGYKNLLLLNMKGYESSSTIGKKVLPVIDWKHLKEYADGLVCLTACGNGIVGQLLNDKKFDEAEKTLLELSNIFGDDLGVEIQTHNLMRGATYFSGSVDQPFTNRHLIRLAQKHNLRIVPTNNTLYIKKDEAETHDVMLAIGAMQPVYSNARIKYNVQDLYLKSSDEVIAFFSRTYGQEFAEKICANTTYLADRCEDPIWIDPKYSNPSGKELPIFPVKDEPSYSEYCEWLKSQSPLVQQLDIDKSYMRYKCELGLNKIPQNKINEYQARLDEEIEVIEYHGFSSYMLIVADYIEWARKQDIRLGFGRGSVGGSLIGYLLDIHVADPIKYGLIFARFHNKEKTSFPDIDTDFSSTGRDLVIDYITNKYGSEHVAHVSNINTITPKVFVKDIARSCDLANDRQASVKLGNEIADSIPKEIDIRTLAQATSKSPLFVEYMKRYPALTTHAAICGKFRAWATHAGGLIISNRPLGGFIPLRKDKDGQIAIEFDKDKAEENGLVKMDMLGIETLNIIDETYKLIEKAGKPLPPDPPNFDIYDKETYDLISRGDTFCVFQLGTSGGTIDLCRRVKPTTINDIAAINSLARPSARDIRDKFIRAKEGKEKVKLLHPSLQRSFGETFGCGLYEECLMYLAQDVAGWSLHEADRLRKLTKEKGKNPQKAMQWRTDFINDALKNNNIPNEIAQKIWDEVVDKFQGYGFNKPHAVFYSMMGYFTAYLKAHYPIEFLLANLASENRSGAKIAKKNIEKIKQEIRARGVKIIPPDLNKSDTTYKLFPDGSLLTGFDALKSVGDEAIKDIISQRPFTSFYDFMVKTDSGSVRAPTIQALAVSGAFNEWGISKRLIYLYCSDYRKKLTNWLKRHDPKTETFEYPWPANDEWSKPELYALEKDCMGESFSVPKIDAYPGFFDKHSVLVRDVKKLANKESVEVMRVEIKSVFELKVKKEGSKYLGQAMLKATIEDKFGDQISLTIFPKQWAEVKKRMKEYGNKVKFDEGLVISFSGSVNIYEDEVGVVLENLFDIRIPPPLPKDRKAKSVSKKTAELDKKINDIDINKDIDNFLESLEEQLFDEGSVELEEDPNND